MSIVTIESVSEAEDESIKENDKKAKDGDIKDKDRKSELTKSSKSNDDPKDDDSKSMNKYSIGDKKSNKDKEQKEKFSGDESKFDHLSSQNIMVLIKKAVNDYSNQRVILEKYKCLICNIDIQAKIYLAHIQDHISNVEKKINHEKQSLVSWYIRMSMIPHLIMYKLLKVTGES